MKIRVHQISNGIRLINGNEKLKKSMNKNKTKSDMRNIKKENKVRKDDTRENCKAYKK